MEVYGMSNNMSIQNVGIGLMIVGFMMLLGDVFYESMSGDANLIIKLSIAAIILGMAVILLSLVNDKIALKDDEIERKY